MIESFKNYYLIIKNLNFTKKFYLFSFMTLIATFFEVASIGSLLPLLNVIVDENIFNEYQSFKPIFYFLSPLKFFGEKYSSHLNLIAGSSMVVLILFVIKFFYLVFFEWYKAQFIHKLDLKLTNKIFKKYMLSPFSYHVEKNTSTFHRDIQSDINYFVGTANAFALLLTEIFVVIGILGLIFTIEFTSTITALITVLIFGTIFLKLTSRFNIKLGKIVHNAEEKRVKHLIQGVEGIKDVIIFNKQNSFIDAFNESNKIMVNAKKKYAIVLSLPRLFTEILLIFGFLIIMFFLLLSNTSVSESIPILGFFAGASFRITPSAYRIMNSIQRVKFTTAAINNINYQVNLDDPIDIYKKSNFKINFKDKLVIKNLTFSYSSRKDILKNINLELKEGEAIGIFGQSGSGKTTLVNLITGLFLPTSGKILSNKDDISKNLSSWRENIGYVPQSIFLTDNKLKNNIAFGINESNIDQSSLNDAVKNAELSNFANTIQGGLDANVGEKGAKISGGQLQRVGIARALYFNPKILIFDESTSSLDKKTEGEIIENIYNFKGKRTLILISHKLDLLKRCDHIYELKDSLLQKV